VLTLFSFDLLIAHQPGLVVFVGVVACCWVLKPTRSTKGDSIVPESAAMKSEAAVWTCFAAFVVVSHGFVMPSFSVSFASSKIRFPSSSKQQGTAKYTSSAASDPEKATPSFWERLASSLSQKANTKTLTEYDDVLERDSNKEQFITLLRVGIPSILAGIAGFLLFPALALSLASLMNDAGVFAVLSQDSSQFVQNFLTVSGLLFSILVGQTYYFMYGQQEAVYYALFNEVTEAKSLLEQVALVCQGRAMYSQVLNAISNYVKNDLKRLQDDPAVLLSARPVDDPLESIMYMTSVGVPSSVYETVRSLRQARAGRLGALQRKLPPVHLLLLWILAGIELVSFPLLGAGTQTIGGYNILCVEGCLFGITTFGIVMTLRVRFFGKCRCGHFYLSVCAACCIKRHCASSFCAKVVGELWRPAGGAYNVDAVLRVMVSGLEEELKARLSGSKVYSANSKSPSSLNPTAEELPSLPVMNINAVQEEPPILPILNQGADLGIVFRGAKRVTTWLTRKIRRSK
jgi:hypothetical protein